MSKQRGILSLECRFWKKVNKQGPLILDTNCWVWTAATAGAGHGLVGYGAIGSGRKPCRQLCAHRVSWEIHYGVIPIGKKVLHKCDNTLCVNPSICFWERNKIMLSI